MTTKNNKLFITGFILPCVLVLLIVYFYPVMRTVCMGFFRAGGVTAAASGWRWHGLGNYEQLMQSKDFLKSVVNMLKLFVFVGALTVTISIILGVILSAKAQLPGRNFFRTIIYMPNMLSAIAIGNAFTYYVFQEEFGLLVTIEKFFKTFGVLAKGMGPEGLSFGEQFAEVFQNSSQYMIQTFEWMTSTNKFNSMMFAVLFCGVGYYMLVMISGIESIPDDLYEAAVLDGAGPFRKFFHITLPLMKGTIRTMITFWSISALQMFAWNQVFSPLGAESSTISPIVYMYEILFGSALAQVEPDAGLGAAVGVFTALLTQVIYTLLNWLLKSDDLEF